MLGVSSTQLLDRPPDEKGNTMDNTQMFCFQCEQTARTTACTGKAGVCGKQAETAGLQDELTGALVSLARAAKGRKTSTEQDEAMLDGMFACVTNVAFDDAAIDAILARVRRERDLLAAGEPAPELDMRTVWEADEDVRSLKSLILFGWRGVAAYAHHAHVLGYDDPAIMAGMYEGMAALAEDWGMDELLPLVLKAGEINLTCMALLDKANTETYGAPAPNTVPCKVVAGPFIVVTGHDLHDLKLLLEQTEGKGVNIYTHGEMLPGHAYPELRKYAHLKGNFGTAWQNQQKEFDNLPAPILFTTNCLMPPRGTYADRVFTTAQVSFPGAAHIGDDKDFTPVIEKALELGGFAEDRQFEGLNGGATMTTGFGRDAVLGVAGAVIDAVKAGDIRHFFLVGGCDGARMGRSYYTDFVKQTPKDTVILTLACGKYRFNDLDLGDIDGIPRLLDVGQCNDAYGAIQIALALADAFGCGVNDLPLSMVLSWYEQKAVCILLTLLYLGIKDIYLGPSLPAFVSPNVLSFLVENYGIRPVSTPEEDLAAILG